MQASFLAGSFKGTCWTNGNAAGAVTVYSVSERLYNGVDVGRIPWHACSVRCRWLLPNGLPLNVMDRRLDDRLVNP